MNRFLKWTFGLTLVALLAGVVSSRPIDPHQVELGGATWYSDLEVAQRMAAEEQKPLLVLDLVGRLDEKWC